MGLTLTPDHIRTLQADAQQAYPHEGCGLLLGTIDRATRHCDLHHVKLVHNAWEPSVASTLTELSAPGAAAPTRSRRYWIDPKDMLTIQREARAVGLSIIGVYHSHPDHVAVPSECDRAIAWPDYAYIIVSVDHGSAVDLQCWRLDDRDQFQPEPITVIHPVAHRTPLTP
ncbi:MAG: M67 family metallopeptidase [Cyanobacteria bacterium P01_A01_bin.105]